MNQVEIVKLIVNSEPYKNSPNSLKPERLSSSYLLIYDIINSGFSLELIRNKDFLNFVLREAYNKNITQRKQFKTLVKRLKQNFNSTDNREDLDEIRFFEQIKNIFIERGIDSMIDVIMGINSS